MQEFKITIYQPTEVVEGTAQIMGWDGTGSAKDFVAAALGPIVKEAVADIMLQPAKESLKRKADAAFTVAEEGKRALEELKPQILQAITIE